MKLGILGAQIEQGQQKAGVGLGPNWIRYEVIDKLPFFSEILTDYGQVKEDPNDLDNVYTKLYYQARKCLANEDFSLFLGGDHSLSISSISAVLEEDSERGVLWFDAHGDMNTEESSPTGNLHGMPVSYLLGLMKNYQRFPWCYKSLDPKKIVFLGVRDLDPGERKIIEDLKIKIISSEDIRRLGAYRATEMAIEYLNCERIHFSFDIDGVDPEVTSATGTPVGAGVSFAEVMDVFSALGNSKKVKSMDLVELNPLEANDQQDLKVAAQIFCELMCQVFDPVQKSQHPLPFLRIST